MKTAEESAAAEGTAVVRCLPGPTDMEPGEDPIDSQGPRLIRGQYV